jgi:hypothetical protein
MIRARWGIDSMLDPTDPPLTALIDAAFRQAAAKVVRRARQCGTPIIIWENGELRSIPPEQVPERFDADLRDVREAEGEEASAETAPLREAEESPGLD